MHALQSFLTEIGHLWWQDISINITRYVTFAVAVWLVLWIALAALLKARKIRVARPPARQLAGEFLFSVRSMVVFSTVGLSVTFLDRGGFYPMANLSQRWGPLWFGFALVTMIVAHDAYFYWVHRLMHDPRLFRRVHRRHHKSHNPSPFTAYSFDVNEALLMVAFMVVWPAVFPTPWGVSGLFMLHQIFRNTLLHAGYELMPARRDGRPWLDFMTTATHHDLHHGQAGYNYAAWFTWWDRWMGTEHPDYLARYAQAAWRPLPPRAKPEPKALEA